MYNIYLDIGRLLLWSPVLARECKQCISLCVVFPPVNFRKKTLFWQKIVRRGEGTWKTSWYLLLHFWWCRKTTFLLFFFLSKVGLKISQLNQSLTLFFTSAHNVYGITLSWQSKGKKGFFSHFQRLDTVVLHWYTRKHKSGSFSLGTTTNVLPRGNMTFWTLQSTAAKSWRGWGSTRFHNQQGVMHCKLSIDLLM